MKLEFRRNSLLLWLLGFHIDEEVVQRSERAPVEIDGFGALLAVIRTRIILLWYPDRNPILELRRQMSPDTTIKRD